MRAAFIAIFVIGLETLPMGDWVCPAEDGPALVQLGRGLRRAVDPAPSALHRALALLQTEAEVHPDTPADPQDVDLGGSAEEAVPENGGRPDVAGARLETHGHGVATIVMPPKTVRDGVAMIASKQDTVETQQKPENKTADDEDHEDAGRKAESAPEEVSDSKPPTTKHIPAIYELPSDECEKPCKNGICHDGECFCRYPFIGTYCEIEGKVEISTVLAVSAITFSSLTTALCILVAFRSNQKTSLETPVEEPHMADEEWLPPSDS